MNQSVEWEVCAGWAEGCVGPVRVADLAPGQLGPDQGLLDSDKQCEPLGICTLGCDLARSGF